MNRTLHLTVVAALMATVPLFAGARLAHAQNVELVTKAEREIEVLDKGARVKRLAPADKIVPGDDVIYTISYSNKTGKPAEKVVITNAVPKNTRYREGSAAGEGAAVVFSVDSGKTFAAPDRLTVTLKDKSGQDVTRPAAAADYTHVRWVLKDNVAPGKDGFVRYRAVIQ